MNPWPEEDEDANTAMRLRYVDAHDYPAWCEPPQISSRKFFDGKLHLVALVWRRLCRYVVLRLEDVTSVDGSVGGRRGTVVDCGDGSCAAWCEDINAPRLAVGSSSYAIEFAGGGTHDSDSGGASDTRKRRSTSLFSIGRSNADSGRKPSIFDMLDDASQGSSAPTLAAGALDRRLIEPPKLTFIDFSPDGNSTSKDVHLSCAPVSIMGSGPLVMVAFGPDFDPSQAFGGNDAAASAWNASVGGGRNLATRAQFYSWELDEHASSAFLRRARAQRSP